MVLDDKIEGRLAGLVADVLSEGEELQWWAQPKQGFWFTPFFCAFCVPLAVAIVSGLAGLDYYVPDPAFALVAVLSVVSGVIFAAKLDAFVRARTVYFLTDQRVGTAYSWPFPSVTEIPHGDWTSINFTRLHKNSGFIIFESRGDDKRAIRWGVLDDFDDAMTAAKGFRKPS